DPFYSPGARSQFYLITDANGVFEFRLDQSAPWDPAGEDHRGRFSWKFDRDDYAYCTGAGRGDPTAVRDPPTGEYLGYLSPVPGANLTSAPFRFFTPSSARRLTNGLVLIASRTSGTEVSPGGSTTTLPGGDVFMLRPSDFLRPSSGLATDRGSWLPDEWVQVMYWGVASAFLPPSIDWRAPASDNPSL